MGNAARCSLRTQVLGVSNNFPKLVPPHTRLASGRNADPPRDFDPPLVSDSQRLAMGGEHQRAGADHVVIQVLGGPDKLLPTLTDLAGALG